MGLAPINALRSADQAGGNIADMLADLINRAGFSERRFRGVTLFNTDKCAPQSGECPPFTVNRQSVHAKARQGACE